MLTGGNILFAPFSRRDKSPSDLLLCFSESSVLLLPQAPATHAFPTFAMLQGLLPPGVEPYLLLSLPHCNVYGLDTQGQLPASEPFAYRPVGIFREMHNTDDSLLLISAWHMLVWYRRNRFCGACGTPLALSSTERALCCPACQQIVYPTISPAVSVAITNGPRLLLARNARSTFSHFSLIAGYVEVGETLEETVAREVMEEVGLQVKNIRYIASQAWGLSQAEMMGFHAELDGSDQITIQESELSEARWFHRDELTPGPNPVSLSFEMIERFRTKTL